MARKGGRKGGSSAARSAAAKKGWETRRRGGAKAKPAATKRTAASKPKPTAKRGGAPKTTSARGRALKNQRQAAALVRASRGGKGPSAKAVRSVLTAQRARAFYAATGSGKKRSAVKASSAKATAARVAAVKARLGGAGSARPKAARPKAAGASMQKGRSAAASKSLGSGRKIDVQIQRAKPGGQYGPDGHWYPGGAWMSQGKYVGGKQATGVGAIQRSAAQQVKGGSESASRIIRNRAPAPRPITPRGQGLPAQPKLSKTAQKLNDEFFGSSGFLSGNLEKKIRAAGDGGRSPIDNTRYIAALASRVSSKDLRSRTASALRGLSREGRRSYIQNLQDARRDLPFNVSATPRVGASSGQLLNAIRFDLAAREIAGQRRGRRKTNARSSNEEYAWVTNAMLRAPRRR